LAKRKIRALNCLSPKGEFSKPLEQALDGSKTGLDKAKRGMDHGPVFYSAKVLPNFQMLEIWGSHFKPHVTGFSSMGMF
jgi:hypothetical protein